MALAEELMVAAFKEGMGVAIPTPFPRLTYAEASSPPPFPPASFLQLRWGNLDSVRGAEPNA